MKKITKSSFAVLSVVALAGLGYEVSHHESNAFSPAARKMEQLEQKVSLTSPAYAVNLDRGFADLAKRVIPGVVNISTFARPRIQPGIGGPGGMYQDDLFRRFFEEFFGGRMPPGRIQPGPGPGGPDGEDEGPVPAPGPRAKAPKGAKSVPLALGTGFIIDAEEGLIVTNNHVVQGAEEVKIQFREEETDLIPAEIIGRDPELDIALLKVKSKAKLTALPLGDSDAIEVGEYVLAIGNPLGYGHTVSHGILSAKGRRNPEFRMGLYLQTDASINPGNSGGPLVNMRGEVIGINNAIDARAQGIGFAIPSNLVKGVLTQLKTKGTVSRGFLGVSAADLTPEVAEQLGISTKIQGVVVSDVARGQAADKAGIKPYDVITAVNGEKVLTAQDLTLKITSVPVGQTATVDIVRGGKNKTLEVKVGERPIAGALPMKPKGREKSSGAYFADFGFKAEELTPQNIQNYPIPPGAVQGKAVVVSDIEDQKPAMYSGLNIGDIIIDVGGKDGQAIEIHTVSDLEKQLKSAKGRSIMVRVRRFDRGGNDFVTVVVLTK